MQFVNITEETEEAFFHCLSLQPTDSQVRRCWYAEQRSSGYRAKVLLDDDGQVIGKCHYGPIEISPLTGQDLTVIFCLYVHMYNRGPGDQRGKGYGRFMLDAVEKEARSSGAKGVAAWAMDWSWNPVSFYEHAGYVEVDREDKTVAVWKPFCSDAKPPRLLRLPKQPEAKDKVNVLVADNAWCNGLHKQRVARDAVKGLEDIVEYVEVGPPYEGRMIHLGRVGGVFLNGEPYRPYELIGESSELRNRIIDLYEIKKMENHR